MQQAPFDLAMHVFALLVLALALTLGQNRRLQPHSGREGVRANNNALETSSAEVLNQKASAPADLLDPNALAFSGTVLLDVNSTAAAASAVALPALVAGAAAAAANPIRSSNEDKATLTMRLSDELGDGANNFEGGRLFVEQWTSKEAETMDHKLGLAATHFSTWPGNDPDGVPIKLFLEDGKKVRNRANNDVGKIVALKSASGQFALKFKSDRFPMTLDSLGIEEMGSTGIYWLQPSEISHDVVGYTYIPPHQGHDEDGRIYQFGDKVIVVDPENKWAFRKEGTVGSTRSGNHDSGAMRVDFGGVGPLASEFGWFMPSQLKHAEQETLQLERGK